LLLDHGVDAFSAALVLNLLFVYLTLGFVLNLAYLIQL